jgi:hypothetical protein
MARRRESVVGRKRTLVAEAFALVARASQLIETPSRWTREHWALDARGREVALTSPAAVRFCLVGAVYRAEHELHGTEIVLAADAGQLQGPPRVLAILDALCNHCRLDLAKRYGIRFVDRSGEGEPPTGVTSIGWRELPIVYNESRLLSHRDMLRALAAVRTLLLYFSYDDEALRKYVRLPARPGKRS